ncbi:hypothetical protein FQN54_009931 [Arachnomyces sp. PD_36]|nr:hypothetical protein FQN54_009931 [Arachnomyces sp. PD_36]
MDCRGLEFTDFKPDGEWEAVGADTGSKFSGIDLAEGEWYDYDEKAGEEVSIKEINFDPRKFNYDDDDKPSIPRTYIDILKDSRVSVAAITIHLPHTHRLRACDRIIRYPAPTDEAPIAKSSAKEAKRTKERGYLNI